MILQNFVVSLHCQTRGKTLSQVKQTKKTAIMNLKHKNILLIKVNDGIMRNFNSALDKTLFINSHDARGYELFANYAIQHLYICIDTEGTGWVLNNKKALTLEECKTLIEMYL